MTTAFGVNKPFFFTQRGWNVLAIDLPGHGQSLGQAPTSVEEACSVVAETIKTVGITRVALAGHSWGSLIALRLAALDPALVTHLALLGTAFPMRVSRALMDASLQRPEEAIRMITQYSFSRGQPHSGHAELIASLSSQLLALMNQLQQAAPCNLLHLDLQACNTYSTGLTDIAHVVCPTLFMLGNQDRMTPPKAALALIQACEQAQVVEIEAGHAMMSERPQAVLEGLWTFFSPEAFNPSGACETNPTVST